MSRLLVVFAVLPLVAISSLASGADWLRFRGPNGAGIADNEVDPPVTWSETENLKWKIALPGPGSSCPIVVGDRVFVTSWSGYGVSRDNTGEQSDLRRHLSCIDRNSGKELWLKTIEPYLPEDEYGGMFAEHGYASHTPVSDGKHVFAYFGKTGAFAFDLEGNQLWQRSVGTESGARNWGTASSPILYKDLLIVTATAECEGIVALDKKTGREVWRQEASGFSSVWGTPILVEVDEQRTDLVIAVPGEIWGFDPSNGDLVWHCDALGTNSFCSSVVANEGMIYAVESGPGGGGGIAVRAGGTGDVTESHVEWMGQQAGRIGSPLIHDGRIYSVSRGVMNCFDTANGKDVFQKRLQKAAVPSSTAGASSTAETPPAPGQRRRGRGRRGGGGQDYSSPVMAGSKIYFTSRGGDIHVFEVGKDFKQLAVNRLTDEREDFSATPAISRGDLFIRSSKNLYCVKQAKE